METPLNGEYFSLSSSIYGKLEASLARSVEFDNKEWDKTEPRLIEEGKKFPYYNQIGFASSIVAPVGERIARCFLVPPFATLQTWLVLSQQKLLAGN